MVQDPNVERMIREAIAPLTKEIKELKSQIESLKQVNKFAIPDVISSCDCRDYEVCYYCEFDKCGTRNLTPPI